MIGDKAKHSAGQISTSSKQISNMIFHIFDKFDLIESSCVVPEKILGLDGACSTFLSQLHGAPKKWLQRVMEWVGGALCAIYGSELAANTLYHSLDKFDLIDSSYVVPEKNLGLAGFFAARSTCHSLTLRFTRLKNI